MAMSGELLKDLPKQVDIPSYEKFHEANKWLSKNNKIYPTSWNAEEDSRNFMSVDINSAVSIEKIRLCTLMVANKSIDCEVPFTEYPKNFDDYYRTLLLRRIAEEFEANIEIFCEMEALVRGILPKDTKNSGMPVLLDYIRTYACLTHTAKHLVDKYKRAEIILNDNPISIFGMVIGRSVAAAIPLKIITVPTMFPIATLLLDLARKVGLSKGMVHLVPMILPSPEKLQTLRASYLINRSSDYPMIVFEDANIPGACDSVVSAAWQYAGKAHFRLKTILVQTSVFDLFVEKLKTTVAKIKYGYADNAQNDISYAANDCKYVAIKQFVKDAEKMQEEDIEVIQTEKSGLGFKAMVKYVKSAQEKDLEIIQTKKDALEFTPTVILKSKVYSKDEIKEEESTGNIVFVLRFTNLDEAVKMAHEENPSAAVSVWTENIETAYKTASELTVSNIWINSHGMISADIPYMHRHKCEELHFIGGKEGILQKGQNFWIHTDYEEETQQQWSLVPLAEKIRKIHTFLDYMENENERFQPCKLKKQFLNDVRKMLDASFFENKSKIHKGYVVTTLKEPRGVIRSSKTTNIISGLLNGNHVIYKSNPTSVYFNELESYFKDGVLQQFVRSWVTSEHYCDLGSNYEEDYIYSLFKNIWVKCM